jgi:hypothetical protein
MKYFLISCCLLAVALSGLEELKTDCLDQYVPNSNNICIRPDYIDGCEIYRNIYECNTCQKGWEKSEKSGKCESAEGTQTV